MSLWDKIKNAGRSDEYDEYEDEFGDDEGYEEYDDADNYEE